MSGTNSGWLTSSRVTVSQCITQRKTVIFPYYSSHSSYRLQLAPPFLCIRRCHISLWVHLSTATFQYQLRCRKIDNTWIFNNNLFSWKCNATKAWISVHWYKDSVWSVSYNTITLILIHSEPYPFLSHMTSQLWRPQGRRTSLDVLLKFWPFQAKCGKVEMKKMNVSS